MQRTKPQIQKPHADKTISRPAILHNKPNNQRASILHAALTENSRPLAGGYASVNRFARNGGRSLGSINPQNTEHIKVTAIRRTASQVKCSCSADIARQVTFRRLSAVDRYIIAVRRCYRSIRRMLLTVYTSLFCYLNFDGLLFWGACGFWICWFVLFICFVRSVFGLMVLLFFM